MNVQQECELQIKPFKPQRLLLNFVKDANVNFRIDLPFYVILEEYIMEYIPPDHARLKLVKSK